MDIRRSWTIETKQEKTSIEWKSYWFSAKRPHIGFGIDCLVVVCFFRFFSALTVIYAAAMCTPDEWRMHARSRVRSPLNQSVCLKFHKLFILAVLRDPVKAGDPVSVCVFIDRQLIHWIYVTLNILHLVNSRKFVYSNRVRFEFDIKPSKHRHHSLNRQTNFFKVILTPIVRCVITSEPPLPSSNNPSD